MRNILVLMTISAAMAFTGCQQVGSTAKDETAKTVAASPTVAPNKTADFQTISLADAKKEYDAGTAIIVDARGEAAWKNERIKDSINIPFETLDAKYKELPTDKKIIAYCSCPAEHTSGEMVKRLKEKGITNAYALVGGTNAWKTANYPMQKEDK